MPRQLLIVDTDPGIDDALALLLAARWPRADLRAVTVTYGNTTLDIATRNARLVLQRAGSRAAVFAGAERPLARALITAKETHGAEGLGDHAAGPAPAVTPSAGVLVAALRAAPAPVVLVTLGPLTNLACALRADAALVRSRVSRHVAMGGNIEAAGNTGPHSEFNFWCDPEAVHEVLGARLGTELVGLDVTRQLVIPARAVAALASHDDPAARWLGALLGFYVRFHEDVEGLRGAVINDPLAIALALEPGWGKTETYPLRMNLSDGPERGRTTIGAGGDPLVRVYRQFDHLRVYNLLVEHVFGPWLTPQDFQP